MKNEKFVKRLFETNQGILTIKELKENGIDYYYLNQFLAAEKIERVKPGFYRWTEFTGDELMEVLRLVPEGVISLYTAAAYHELTTFISSTYHVTIEKNRRVSVPEYPPIKLYYWSGAQLSLGKEEINLNEGVSLIIYDKEKTVCDFIKFRNKVGIDLTKEVLNNYLRTKDRSISKLMDYAKKLKVTSVIKKYLEVLL